MNEMHRKFCQCCGMPLSLIHILDKARDDALQEFFLIDAARGNEQLVLRGVQDREGNFNPFKRAFCVQATHFHSPVSYTHLLLCADREQHRPLYRQVRRNAACDFRSSDHSVRAHQWQLRRRPVRPLSLIHIQMCIRDSIYRSFSEWENRFQ